MDKDWTTQDNFDEMKKGRHNRNKRRIKNSLVSYALLTGRSGKHFPRGLDTSKEVGKNVINAKCRMSEEELLALYDMDKDDWTEPQFEQRFLCKWLDLPEEENDRRKR